MLAELFCSLLIFFIIYVLLIRYEKISKVEFYKDADILVIGGGVFGCAFAYAMAKFGHKIIVIEKDVEADQPKLLGEYLQPGGIAALDILGMKDVVEGYLETRGYILHHNDSNSSVDVTYLNTDKTRINGVTFHYNDFVKALRRKLGDYENIKIIPGTVTRILKEEEVVVGVEYENEGETAILRATLNVLSDGSLSKLKTQVHAKIKETRFSYFIGCLLEDCPQTKEGYADIVLTQSTPILVYKIGPSTTRLLVDVSAVPTSIQRFMKEKVLPEVPEHMRPSIEDAAQNADMMIMPCRSTANSFPIIPGLIHAGDSFNTRHPLTGGGFTVALYDAILLRDRLEGVDLSDYSRVLWSLRTFGLERAIKHSFVVNVMSFALHQVFAPVDEITRHLRSACIAYLQREGECLSGPTNLLAVSVSSPLVFIYHFFSVAVHCCYLISTSHPFMEVHKTAYEIYSHISKACGIVCPLVWNELRTILSI